MTRATVEHSQGGFIGAECAAFHVSILTASYGFLQTFLSPFIGWVVEPFGFTGAFVAMAAPPVAGIALPSQFLYGSRSVAAPHG